MEPAPAPHQNQKSILGRVIVFVLFGGVIAYFAVAVLGSILTDLYGKSPPVDVGELGLQERTWCIRSLVGLREELEGQVTLETQHPKRDGDPFSRWEIWTEGWEKKFERAESRCTQTGNSMMDRAFAELEAMSSGYGVAVENMIRTRSEVASSLQDAIGVLKKQR